MKHTKKKTLKNLFFIFGIGVCSIAIPTILSSCGVSYDAPNSNNGNSNGNNDNSSNGNNNEDGNKDTTIPPKPLNEMQSIANMTVSLNFAYRTGDTTSGSMYVQSGTGWIYDVDYSKNDYYIATNLHVANILSFENKTIQQTEATNTGFQLKSTTYQNIVSSYLRFVPLNLSSTNDTYYDTSLLENVYVQKPTVVYTTTSDSQYNNLFGKVYGISSSTSLSSTYTTKQYQAATDIAILKYHLPLNNSYYSSNTSTHLSGISSTPNMINDFIMWLRSYKANNQITLYDQPIDNLIGKQDVQFYMGGFPAHNKAGKQEITWTGFNAFSLQTQPTSVFQYPWNLYANDTNKSQLTTPIAFYNSSSKTGDETTYNFISAGRQGLFNASSYPGSSGSALVAKVDGSLKIVGIYWGAITTSTVGTQITNTYGIGNFLNSTGGNKTFNLNDNIHKAIESSKTSQIK